MKRRNRLRVLAAATLLVSGCDEPPKTFTLEVQLEGLIAYVEDELPPPEGGKPVSSLWAFMPNATYDREHETGFSCPYPVDEKGSHKPADCRRMLLEGCPLSYPAHFAILQTHRDQDGQDRETLTDLRFYDVRFDLKSLKPSRSRGVQREPQQKLPTSMKTVLEEWGAIDGRWLEDKIPKSRNGLESADVLAARILFQGGNFRSYPKGEFVKKVFRGPPPEHAANLEEYCTGVPDSDGASSGEPEDAVVLINIQYDELIEAAIVLDPLYSDGEKIRIPLFPGNDGIAKVELLNKSANHLFMDLHEESHFEVFQNYYRLAADRARATPQDGEGAEPPYMRYPFFAPLALRAEDRCTKILFDKPGSRTALDSGHR